MKKFKYLLLALWLLSSFGCSKALSYAELTSNTARNALSIEDFIAAYCFEDEDSEETNYLPITGVPCKDGLMRDFRLDFDKSDFSTQISKKVDAFNEEERDSNQWYLTLENAFDTTLLSGHFCLDGKKAELYDVLSDSLVSGTTLLKIWDGVCNFLQPDFCYLVDGAEVENMMVRVIRPLCNPDGESWYGFFGYHSIDKEFKTRKNRYFFNKAVNTIRSFSLKKLLSTVQQYQLEHAYTMLQHAHDQICEANHACWQCSLTFGELLQKLYLKDSRHESIKKIYTIFLEPYLALTQTVFLFDYNVSDNNASSELLESLRLLSKKSVLCKSYTHNRSALASTNTTVKPKSLYKDHLLNGHYGYSLQLVEHYANKKNLLVALRYLVLSNLQSGESLLQRKNLFFELIALPAKYQDYCLLARAFAMLVQAHGYNECKDVLLKLLERYPTIAEKYISWLAQKKDKEGSIRTLMYSLFNEVIEQYLSSTNSTLLMKLYTYGSFWRQEWVEKSKTMLRCYEGDLSTHGLLFLINIQTQLRYASLANHQLYWNNALRIFEQTNFTKDDFESVVKSILTIIDIIGINCIENFGKITYLIERFEESNMPLQLFSEHWNTLAHIYCRQENPMGALKAFKGVQEDNPQGIIVFEYLHELYKRFGEQPGVVKAIHKLCMKEIADPQADTINAARLFTCIVSEQAMGQSQEEIQPWSDAVLRLLNTNHSAQNNANATNRQGANLNLHSRNMPQPAQLVQQF